VCVIWNFTALLLFDIY